MKNMNKFAMTAAITTMAVLGWKAPALGQSCGCSTMFAPNSVLTSAITVYPNYTVTNGDPNPYHGFTTPAATFAIDVSDPSAPLPTGEYPAWCIDSGDNIDPTLFTYPGSTVYTGTLLSTCDTNSLQYVPILNDPVPVGPPPIVTVATWHEVNYILNHKSPPTYNYYWWNVQAAINRLVGGPAGNDPDNNEPGYPPVDTNQVEAILADAAANAPNWTVPCGGTIGVIYNISEMLAPANQDAPFQLLLMEVPCTCPQQPSLQLVKTVSTNLVAPGQIVTYFYAVTNTGPITITNINIVDDNGTPSDTSDDYYVNDAPFSLNAGQGMVFALPHITEPMCAMNGKTNLNAGSLTINVLPNGNVEVYFLESQSINDNRYGTNANTATGWKSGRKFSDLLNNNEATFMFTDGKGKQVLAFQEDYLSQASSAKIGGTTVSYPSGYGTLGVTGGDGEMFVGSSANVLQCRTTLSDSLNQSSPFYKYTVNSPPETKALSSVSVPAGWDYTLGYYALISSNAFGANGFGQVIVGDVHNSSSKLCQSTSSSCGSGYGYSSCGGYNFCGSSSCGSDCSCSMDVHPCSVCSCVENTAVAEAYSGTNLVAAAYANATVCFTPNTNNCSNVCPGSCGSFGCGSNGCGNYGCGSYGCGSSSCGNYGCGSGNSCGGYNFCSPSPCGSFSFCGSSSSCGNNYGSSSCGSSYFGYNSCGLPSFGICSFGSFGCY